MVKYTSFSDVCRLYWDKELVVDSDFDDDLDDEEEEGLEVFAQSGILLWEGLLLGLIFSGIFSLVIGMSPANPILLVCVGLIGIYSTLNIPLFEEKLDAVFGDVNEEYGENYLGLSVSSYSKKPALPYKFVKNTLEHPLVFGLSLIVVVICNFANVWVTIFMVPVVFYWGIWAKLSIKQWW